MQPHSCYLTALAICLAAVSSRSQTLSFKTYSSKDGLLSNGIEAIAQDSSGRMWFGTTDGVTVYDGRTMTNYTARSGLPGNYVNQVVPDRKRAGVVWVLAGGGICRFDNNRITPVRLQAGVVTTIHEDFRGVLWCGTNRGVSTVDGDSVARFDPSNLGDQIEHIAEVGDTVLWFSHGATLYSYSRTSGRFDSLDCRTYGNGTLWDIHADRAGILYALMGGSVVVRIRGGKVADSRRVPADPIGMGEDDEGNLWFGGYGGIAKIERDRFGDAPFQHFTTANGLPENTVRCLYIDREQNLWIGGRDNGLAKLSTGHCMRFPLGYVWYWHHHRIAVADSNSHLWIVSDNDLLEVWRDRFQVWHSLKHGLYEGPAPVVSWDKGAIGAVTLDSEGRLWVTKPGTASLIICYKIVPAPNLGFRDDQPSTLVKVRTISLGERFPGTGVLAISACRNGQIWIAGHGMVHLDPSREDPIVRIYKKADGVSENYIREVYEDHLGNIWAGTFSEGAIRIGTDGTIRHYTTADGLPDNGIWTFTEDQSGGMLIGTSNGGIATFDGSSITVPPRRESLPSNKILCATRDSSGRLWLGTSIGMIYEDRPGSKSFIRNQSFIGSGAHCAGTTRSGLLWFITPTDLWVYDYAHDRQDTIHPAIDISWLYVNGFERKREPAIRLSYDETNCEIGFVGISFKDESAIRYLYRLTGSDDSWEGPTYSHSITYGHLHPGDYTFEVKAINLDGIESVKPATLAFAILPPYWETWWFRSLIGVIGVSMGLLIYYRRVASLNKERLAQQEFSRQLIDSQEGERKRVAGELHDDLGQNMIIIVNSAQLGLRATTESQVKEQLREIADTGSRSIQSIREIAYNLSPYQLDKIGLIASIKGMVKKIAEPAGIRFTFDIEALDNIFPKELEINIYRIIQECVNNIVKHSSAAEASLAAHSARDTVHIIIRDQGKGFDPAEVDSASNAGRGFGLSGLSERVKLLKGTLQIETSPGNGTKVIISIPLSLTRQSRKDP